MSENHITAVRRRVGGASLIAGSLLFAAAEFIGPDAPDADARGTIAAYAGHHGDVVTGDLLRTVLTLTMTVGLFALVQVIRRRGAAVAHWALALSLYGLVTAYAVLSGVDLVIAEAAQPGQDRSAAVALFTSLYHDPVGIPIVAGHYLFALGMLLLGVAVLRAGLRPRWAGWCLVAFPVTDVLLSFAPLLANVVSDAAGVAGFTALGVALWRMRDEVWLGLPATEGEPVPVPA